MLKNLIGWNTNVHAAPASACGAGDPKPRACGAADSSILLYLPHRGQGGRKNFSPVKKAGTP